MSADKNYEDIVSKLDTARIEWEIRMQEFCKVSTMYHFLVIMYLVI